MAQDVPTSFPIFRIAVSIVRTMALGLARFGVTSEEFLAKVGLPADARTGFVDDVPIATALVEIAKRKGIPHLGLELASNMSLGWFGSLDYKFSTSATLGEALWNANPELNTLVESMQHALEVDPESGSARLRAIEAGPRPDMPAERALMSDFDLALFARRVRDVVGDEAVKLTEVRFAYPGPATSEAHDQFFGAPVSFNHSGQVHELVFPLAMLSAPLLTADPALAQLLAQRQTPPPPADPFLDNVRSTIDASLGDGEGGLGVAVIGAKLALSGRTLQRKLKEQGVSLSDLIDQRRRALAEDLLSHESVLLCDVGYRLGFTDVKAFFRAFRRWTGTSPRAFQKARL
jgi:AraC-like DNA-binding protein